MSLYQTSVPSAFGDLTIVWQGCTEETRVRLVLLPGERVVADRLLCRSQPCKRPEPDAAIERLAEQLRSFLEGRPVDFEIGLIDLAGCSEFQRRVLLAEHQVPRGRVTTYGRIARSLGLSGAARAVGTALARNPFPIIIPCHRTIRSNGDLGGFRGGLEMKRALLKMEGVEFSASGKVLSGRFYY